MVSTPTLRTTKNSATSIRWRVFSTSGRKMPKPIDFHALDHLSQANSGSCAEIVVSVIQATHKSISACNRPNRMSFLSSNSTNDRIASTAMISENGTELRK